MSNSVSPEEMSLEQIKEQLALYNRLYYQKRRHEKDFMETKKSQCNETLQKESNG